MPDFIALDVDAGEDLLPLSQYLWRQGVSHRIVEEQGRLLLLVQHAALIDGVRELHRRWQRGDSLPERFAVPKPRRGTLSPRRAPVTLTLIALSIVGFLVATLMQPLLHWFTFFPFELENAGRQIAFAPPGRQYWRFITPIFLHFGLLHIVFNMLWLWDLGRRVELVQGKWRLLLIVLIIGVASNITQAVAQTSIFGGMSGVVYGLLGYCWVWGWLRRDPILHVPLPVLVVMLAMLLLGMTGVMQLMGVGAIANAAHVGGLIMGFLLGFATVLFGRKTV